MSTPNDNTVNDNNNSDNYDWINDPEGYLDWEIFMATPYGYEDISNFDAIWDGLI